jgi:hypothetical protein
VDKEDSKFVALAAALKSLQNPSQNPLIIQMAKEQVEICSTYYWGIH